MNAPTEHRVALSQLSLAAQVWGDPDQPTLLALHGWLDNAGSFARLAPLLASHFRVIVLELPGHGHSGHLPAGCSYHLVDYVRYVLAAFDALELQRCSLLGHSLGAGVASLLAAAAPDRIERLFLIEGLGPIGDDGTHTLKRFRDALTTTNASGKPLRVFPDIDVAIKARGIASGLPADQARPIVGRGLIETEGGWRWRSDPRLTGITPIRLTESQIHALLRGIEAPTKLVLAEPAAPYLPIEPMKIRAACVPNIHVSHMSGGHHLHLEHPQAIADWITNEM